MKIPDKVKTMLESQDSEIVVLGVRLLIDQMKEDIDIHEVKYWLYDKLPRIRWIGLAKPGNPVRVELRRLAQVRHMEILKNKRDGNGNQGANNQALKESK